MKAPTVLLLLALTACGNTTAAPEKALVPVAADCVPAALPQAPVYPDTDKALVAATDAADRYRLLILGREIRVSRLGTLEGVIDACRGASD